MESATVKLNVTHSKREMKAMELRFSTVSTIAAIKVTYKSEQPRNAIRDLCKFYDVKAN